MILTSQDQQRFWSKVDKRSPDECWFWLANTIGGYGQFWIQGRQIAAHRISWIIHFGSLHDNVEVCHYCNMKPCINPYHLYTGTHAQNMADAARDGLMRRPSKLSRDEIAQIKFLAKSMNKSELARLYKVHRQTISAIIADTPFRQLRKRAKNKS